MNGSYELFACRASVRFHCAKIAVALWERPTRTFPPMKNFGLVAEARSP
jgi:hypothetical protein